MGYRSEKEREFKEGLKVPNIKREIERNKEENERYKAKRGTKSKAKQRAKRMRKRLVKRIGLLVATGALAFGSLTACNAYKEHKEKEAPITLEMAMENGKDLNELGINNEISKELEYLKIQLENSEDLDINELIELGERINELQFDTIKAKIRNATQLEEGTIKLLPSKDGEPAKIVVGEQSYYQKDIGDFLSGRKEISDNMVSYINEIVTIQNVMEDLQNGDSSRKDLLKHYNKAVNDIDKLAASEIKLDDKGNIEMETTKVSEIEAELGDNQEEQEL